MKLKFLFALLLLAMTAAFAEPELVIQEGNAGAVKYLKYSNDGKYIMSATFDEAKIYERESGALVKSFNLGVFKDFSPNAKYIVSCASSDNGWRIFLTNIATREEVVIGAANEKAKTYSFSPDGNYLAVQNEDFIDIYDVKTLKKQSILADSGYYFYYQVAWSADCRYLSILASAVKGKVASVCIVYDRQQNKMIKVVDKYKGKYRLYLTSISPDAACIAYARKDIICIESVFSDNVNESFSLVDGYESEPLQLSFSYDGKKLYALKERGLEEYDMTTWKHNTKKTTGSVYSLALPPYEKKGIVLGRFQNIEIHDDRYFDNMFFNKTISGVSHWTDILRSNTGNIFVSDIYGKETALFTPSFEKLPLSENLPKRKLARDSAFTDAGLYYSDYKNKKIFLRNVEKNKDATVLERVSAERIMASVDGSLLAVYDDKKNETFVYDVNKKKRIVVQGLESMFLDDTNSFSPFCSFVYFNMKIGKKGYVYDLKKSKIALTVENANRPNFSFDEKYFAVPKNDSNTVDVYDTGTWTVVKTFGGNNESYYYPFFSSDKRYIGMNEMMSGKLFISVYSLSDWKLVKKISVPRSEFRMFFNDDSSQIITMGGAGIIHCYSMVTGNLISSTIGNETGDWLTYTPEGYFNGSEDGIKKFVHLVNGMEVSELGQYAETFYRPDLVAAKLRGEDVAKKEGGLSLSQVVATGHAPVAQFVNTPAASDSRDITVNFTVKDQGGGIGSVYLKLNDKVIQLADGSRKLALEAAGSAQKSAGAAARFSHTVTLQNGENTLEAYATNAAGKIESLHAVAKIAWKGAASKPSLHVLSVGVNKYRDRSLWLQYSVPDAQAVLQSFGSKKTSLYKDIFTYELLDGDVTKENLLAKFNSISPKVAADDVFILFVAGHGTTSQKTGDYYFIPSNFRYTDSDAILSQGISKSDILACMSGIKASKTLIMLDTCNSGAFTNDASARGFAEKTAVERLVCATGQAVLAASSEEQSAMEGYKGHGVFTYVLLEALSGKADKNKDGYVTLNELASYIEEQVPELSYQKWGYEQVPMKELRKQDFPLVGK